MVRSAQLTPKSKVVQSYYTRLAEVRAQGVANESHLRDAFEMVLAEAARSRGWTLIPGLEMQRRGRSIVPDGTVRDSNYLPRGYWEAKDEKDDLDTEITTKIAKGYPTTNIIFEDTRQAVLYQDKREALRVDLSNPADLCDLVNTFHDHVEPDIEDFERAVDEFKDRVPAIANGLREKIEEAHRKNPPFQKAFDQFFDLCKQSLNPNIRIEAVDEMLIQHLLTERLFRTVFQNTDFVRRNVIAAEVENVIDALVSQNFSKAEFLAGLNRFYLAIEQAAAALPDFSEKQHFLNTVYERFFQGYSVKVADTHGIVYTPQPIVDFMVSSVQDALRDEFGLDLWSEGVTILDPCTGTGNFIVNILQRIPLEHIERVYKQQLFANELMLLPYYIAALNIEHAYYERTGRYEPFEGLCFVDTLDLAEERQSGFSFMTEANTERVERQKKSHITVIIGNPPYNVGQINENDNNKNRAYRIVDQRVRETYAKESKASSVSKISDPYVRFFRWATDRLAPGRGVLAFVSNNGFLDQLAFDGMRKCLLDAFNVIRHVDLNGNVRRNPKLSGTTHNVFGIQVGVGITIAVNSGVAERTDRTLILARSPEMAHRTQKLAWLLSLKSQGDGNWQGLKPRSARHWIDSQGMDQFLTFPPISARKARPKRGASLTQQICGVYSLGVVTARDEWMYAFRRQELASQASRFADFYNAEVDRWSRISPKPKIDEFVKYDDKSIKWSRDLKEDLRMGRRVDYSSDSIRNSLFRPFTKEFLYYDDICNEETRLFPIILPNSTAESENVLLVTSNIGFRSATFNAIVTNLIWEYHLCDSRDAHQCFPFYVYDDHGLKRENITDWALETYRARYADNSVSKWDIFYYVYAILHHPGYREVFGECLRRELPRIPFAPNFWAFANAGRELADWHLNYESKSEYPLEKRWPEGAKLDYSVHDKMRLDKTKTELRVNPSLTLIGIPERAFDYRLGNRSALEWVIDQYQVKTHARSGILSDPNRPNDSKYIVRLVGQVIQVSLETVRIVSALPAQFCDA